MRLKRESIDWQTGSLCIFFRRGATRGSFVTQAGARSMIDTRRSRALWLGACLAAGLSLACSKTPREPAPEQGVPQREVPVAEPQSASSAVGERTSTKATTRTPRDAAPPEDASFRAKGGARIVAIGDLHGDFEATRRAFRLAKAIDDKDRWVGGSLIVVQTGDQLDRGDDEEEILSFLKRLRKEAASAGGAVHVLNGNHETMNVLGDFRYVTEAALRDFADAEPASSRAVGIPAPYERRAKAFLPGGEAALQLAERPLILMVGDTVFSHGGVLPRHLAYGIDRLNEETSAWMRGDRPNPPALVVDPDGPLWTRIYGDEELSPAVCQVLEKTLHELGAKRLVVGHTVQRFGMSSACSDRVFRIDVGLAHHYGDHPTQVLEITGETARVLTMP